MKRFFAGTVAGMLILFMSACGGSSSNNEVGADTAPDVQYTARYQPTEQQDITVTGNGNDSVVIHFPKYAVDFSESNYTGMDLHITLDYEDGQLKGISFTEDLEFNAPVTITFNVESLSNDDLFLVYKGDEEVLVPFEKNGDTYTYTFDHFSDYEFGSAGSADDQISELESTLSELEAAADKSEGVVPHMNDFRNLLSLVGILEIHGHPQSESYGTRVYAVIGAYAKAYINSVTDPTVYLNGYCIDSAFNEKAKELIKNLAALEEIGSDAPEYNQGLNKLSEWISNLADAFLAKSLTGDCENLSEYVICGLKVAAYAEEFVSTAKGQAVSDKIESEFSSKVNNITSEQVDADLTNCTDLLNCLNIALQAATLFDMTSEISRLENRLIAVENQCHRSDCPYAWDASATINANYTSGSPWNHSATFNDMLFVTTEAEFDAADINDDCTNITTVHTDYSTTFYDEMSSLGFTGTFDDSLWSGTIIPDVYFEDSDSYAEQATFGSDIVSNIRNGQTFTITTSHDAAGGTGTITATITFTPHVPH